MKEKRLILLAVIPALAIALSSCTKLATPNDTIKPPQFTQNNTIMDSYKDMVNRNSSPVEIYKFIQTNIGNLDKEDADTVVSGYVTLQKKQLENYQDKLMSPEINIKINGYPNIDMKNLGSVPDENIRTFLQDAGNNGYKLSSSEGMYYFEMDYEKINSQFGAYVSEDLAAYLAIKSDEGKEHFAEDAALSISLDELARRVVNTENFISKYKESSYLEEIKQLHTWYLTACLIGLNNTPAFSYEDNKIRPEVLASFKNTLEKYKDSGLAGILTEYMDLIRKNDDKKTKEVLNFVARVTATPAIGSDVAGG